ncbi:MAG: hypothetical protein IJU76_05325, partial [Desulfovibrionaceae bacterium]|nr:hypothetical protein [Desulfovibrionaceae bacterium]
MEEKIQWYKEVLALEPNSRLFFPLAVLLSQHGQKEDALETLRRGLERHDEYLEARIFYIELLYSAQRMAEIEPELKKLERMFSHYSGFWQAWAAYIASDGQNDTASIMRFLSLYFSHKEISLHDIINRGIQSLLNDEGMSLEQSGATQELSPKSSADIASDSQEVAPESSPESEAHALPSEEDQALSEQSDNVAEPLNEPPACDQDMPEKKTVKKAADIDPSFGTLVQIDKEAEAELWAVISIIEKGRVRKAAESAQEPDADDATPPQQEVENLETSAQEEAQAKDESFNVAETDELSTEALSSENALLGQETSEELAEGLEQDQVPDAAPTDLENELLGQDAALSADQSAGPDASLDEALVGEALSGEVQPDEAPKDSGAQTDAAFLSQDQVPGAATADLENELLGQDAALSADQSVSPDAVSDASPDEALVDEALSGEVLPDEALKDGGAQTDADQDQV